jgi:hypothetical protein
MNGVLCLDREGCGVQLKEESDDPSGWNDIREKGKASARGFEETFIKEMGEGG